MDGPGEHVRVAPFGAQHLADQCRLHTTGDPDTHTIDVAPEEGAGEVRPMAVAIAISEPGEILLHEVDTPEGGVLGVDARVEHSDRDPRSGVARSIRPDRRDAPGLVAEYRWPLHPVLPSFRFVYRRK